MKLCQKNKQTHAVSVKPINDKMIAMYSFQKLELHGLILSADLGQQSNDHLKTFLASVHCTPVELTGLTGV